ncbi:sensor domain-containing diguanylate cyclase [Halomonas qinghailakensis]|uniref:Sensor domain-containing diguanylate cyclase n=2 Tax=Halomonas TaxID=2745 RepID=A0AA46TRZ2_9GAMM|nr:MULTISPECIES: diguanylate cyclase [Halomonas]UYO75267.1 sensor domain-containing diguanylate cyclase [Halomonas sp. ZZQ-149]UYV19841.1 sensor domain-containing diguanylate cyclase [Halomonas qaidamensis]
MDAYCWLKRLPAGLLVLIISWHTQSSAAATVVVSSEQARYDLNEVSGYWHTSEPLNLDDVLALSPSFQPVRQTSDLHFGYTQNDTWLKTQLHNSSPLPTTWMVKFEYPFLDHVTLYTLRDGSRDVQHSGSAVPIDERSIAHRQAVFPLLLAGGETVTLYTKVNATGSKFLSYSLMTPDAFYTQNDRHNFWLATYFGMLLALSVYNLLLFFGLKERVFLYYALFAFGFTLAILTFNGIGTLMFWSFLGDNTARLVAIGFTFASTMATLFTQSFLNTATYCPRWHHTITLFRGYCYLALIAVIFLPIQPALRLMDITGFTASLLMLACGIYCSWHRVPSARIFVLAWSIFLLGAAVFALRNLSILPANFITLHGIQIGSAIEMLLLSFALAARFNKLKWQKERAQAETVAMLKKQEAVLEAKVAARTQALEKLANHDMLTGLLNRNGLARCAEEALERCKQTQTPLALVMCDLDCFKPINDQYGHEVGDFVLQQVAKRLAHVARESDHCARFGGDEFILLLEGITDQTALEEMRNRIEQAIRSPIKLPCGRLVHVGVSVGISLSNKDNDTLASLLRDADTQMYAVKTSQTTRYYGYGSA